MIKQLLFSSLLLASFQVIANNNKEVADCEEKPKDNAWAILYDKHLTNLEKKEELEFCSNLKITGSGFYRAALDILQSRINANIETVEITDNGLYRVIVIKRNDLEGEKK